MSGKLGAKKSESEKYVHRKKRHNDGALAPLRGASKPAAPTRTIGGPAAQQNWRRTRHFLAQKGPKSSVHNPDTLASGHLVNSSFSFPSGEVDGGARASKGAIDVDTPTSLDGPSAGGTRRPSISAKNEGYCPQILCLTPFNIWTDAPFFGPKKQARGATSRLLTAESPVLKRVGAFATKVKAFVTPTRQISASLSIVLYFPFRLLNEVPSAFFFLLSDSGRDRFFKKWL